MTTLDALFELAFARAQAGDFVAAETLARQILAQVPDADAVWHLLAHVLSETDRKGEGLVAIERALALAPDESAFHAFRGLVLLELGRLEECVNAYAQAIALGAVEPNVGNNLGLALGRMGRPREAVAAYERVLSLTPAYVPATVNLANVLVELGEHDRARELVAPLAATPASCPAAAWNALGNCAQHDGDLPQAIVAYERALALQPTAETASNLAQAHQYIAETPQLLALHKQMGAVIDGAARPMRLDTPSGSLRKVAYLSADFRMHSVSNFLLPILEAHDSALEITLYSSTRKTDATTARFQALGHRFEDVAGLPDAELARRIREDGIQVLVDLSGHSTGNRLAMLAHRPSPVQLTYLGYPGTIGLTSLQGRIGDDKTDPEDAGPQGVEPVWRLPGGFLCYRPLDASLPVGRRSDDAPLTVGSFNNHLKLSPATLSLWASVLCAIPSARLALKSSMVASDRWRQELLGRFAQRGVHAERIEFLSTAPTLAGHMRAYDGMDIALDTTPYAGTTTTCEALWMGVPVVTLLGDRHASRVGASLLSSVGHPEWIASSVEDFVEIVRSLSKDLPALRAMRQQLRSDVAASPLCDAARVARALEDVYRKAYASVGGG